MNLSNSSSTGDAVEDLGASETRRQRAEAVAQFEGRARASLAASGLPPHLPPSPPADATVAKAVVHNNNNDDDGDAAVVAAAADAAASDASAAGAAASDASAVDAAASDASAVGAIADNVVDALLSMPSLPPPLRPSSSDAVEA